MTSRLRAALFQWSLFTPPSEAAEWWWTGLRNEIDVAMAIVGHAVASNVFLDIPNFLRGISQAMGDGEGPDFKLSTRMLEEIQRVPNPTDPTEIVNEYYHDWWIRDKTGRATHNKYGPVRENKPTRPEVGPAPPKSCEGICNNSFCKARLHAAFGEVNRTLQIIRSLTISMEEERVSTERHILHLKALRNYQVKSRLTCLSPEDLKNLIYEAEDGLVDVEMDNAVTRPSKQSTTGILTPQSLSFEGYSGSSRSHHGWR